MTSQSRNVRPTFTLPFSTLPGQPTSSSAISAPSGSPTPSLTFATVPNQLDTCTSQLISWTSSGIYSDDDSDDDDNDDPQAVSDTNPLSVLSVGIAGSYIPPGGIVDQLSFSLFEDVLDDATPPTNFSFNPVDVPPGLYVFYASLLITSDVDNTIEEETTFNFTSNVFAVVNGSDTSCVQYNLPNDPGSVTSLPIPSFSLTSGPANSNSNLGSSHSASQTSSSASISAPPILSSTNKSLSHGAIAGIAIGSILGVLIILCVLALLFIRSRSRRGLNNGSWFGSGSNSHTRSPSRSSFLPSSKLFENSATVGGAGGRGAAAFGTGAGVGLGAGTGRSHVRTGSFGSNISSIIGALRPGTAGSHGPGRDNFVGLRSVDSSKGAGTGAGGTYGAHHPSHPHSPTTATTAAAIGAGTATAAGARDRRHGSGSLEDIDSDSKSLATTYEGPDSIVSQIPAHATLPYAFPHHGDLNDASSFPLPLPPPSPLGLQSQRNSARQSSTYNYRGSGASTPLTGTALNNHNPESRRESGTTVAEGSSAPTTPIQNKRRTFTSRKPVPSALAADLVPAVGTNTNMSTSTLSHGGLTVDTHTTTGTHAIAATATASSTSVTPVIGHGSTVSHSSSTHSHTPTNANFYNPNSNITINPADLPRLNHKSSAGFEGRTMHYLIPDLPSEGMRSESR